MEGVMMQPQEASRFLQEFGSRFALGSGLTGWEVGHKIMPGYVACE
jgi:hypothetical protein